MRSRAVVWDGGGSEHQRPCRATLPQAQKTLTPCPSPAWGSWFSAPPDSLGWGLAWSQHSLCWGLLASVNPSRPP